MTSFGIKTKCMCQEKYNMNKKSIRIIHLHKNFTESLQCHIIHITTLLKFFSLCIFMKRQPLQRTTEQGFKKCQYSDFMMSAMASQMTSLTTACSNFYSGARWTPPHKGPVTRKMFPVDDVIMHLRYHHWGVWEHTKYDFVKLIPYVFIIYIQISLLAI